jgi:predicted amidohydrolase YtcJ
VLSQQESGHVTTPRPALVRGALVHDGSESDPAVADVRIRDGRVSEIAGHLTPAEGEEVVDGGGLALAPGFIDLHSHSDLYTLVRDAPDGAPIGDAPKLLQGVTTQVFGQDGISAAPVHDNDVDESNNSANRPVCSRPTTSIRADSSAPAEHPVTAFSENSATKRDTANEKGFHLLVPALSVHTSATPPSEAEAGPGGNEVHTRRNAAHREQNSHLGRGGEIPH